MRPAFVAPDGLIKPEALLYQQPAEDPDISLITAWHDVRNWRKVLFESDPNAESDLLHAHCFTAGMAGVRNFPAVVYDVNEWIEDHASDSEHTWLARSFRVAEQFVLARAAAVVTRCQSMRQAAIHRGASPENIFVIPQAMEDPVPVERDHLWLQSLGIAGAKDIVLYAPDHYIALGADGKLAPASEQILAAFAITDSEVDDCHLLLEVAIDAETALREALQAYDLDSVHTITADDRSRAYASSDIIIAAHTSHPGISTGANPSALAALASHADISTGANPNAIAAHTSHAGISTGANPNALAAFAARRALLAADLPCNRDLSPTGRGCLWYIDDDARDLAHRVSFLARNADFRNALADAGHGFFLETRNSIAVAQQYDAVYRHAFARRKSNNQSPNTRLLPIQAAL